MFKMLAIRKLHAGLLSKALSHLTGHKVIFEVIKIMSFWLVQKGSITEILNKIQIILHRHNAESCSFLMLCCCIIVQGWMLLADKALSNDIRSY